MSTTIDEAIEQLIAERRRVAPEASNGDKTAKKEWERLDQEIAKREAELRLAEEARTEQQRRDKEAEEQRKEAERQAKEAALAELETDLAQKRQGLEDQISVLSASIEEALAIGARVYQAATELGRQMPWRLKTEIADYVKGQLGKVLVSEFDYIPPSWRRSLVTGESEYQPGIPIRNDSPSVPVETEPVILADDEDDEFGFLPEPRDPDPSTPSPTLADLLPTAKEVA